MHSEIDQLIEICHRVYEKGFVSAYDGNLSMRIADGNILITRSGVNKGEVKKEDIIVIDPDGNNLSGKGKISTENKIHLYVYKKRDDVNGVVHCHPVFVSAFSVTQKSFPSDIFPEVILTLGEVPLCKYATPSTDEVTESMEPYIEKGMAFILQNHGAVTLGKDITEAYYKMEKLEHTAKILAVSSFLGGAKPIPKEKIDELLSISEEVYGIKIK